MTVTTTAHADWSGPVLDSVPHHLPVVINERTSALEHPAADGTLMEHMRGLLNSSRQSAPDPRARARIAGALFRTTHWPTFDDGDERAYVSRLWGEDWDCPEDAAYDEL